MYVMPFCVCVWFDAVAVVVCAMMRASGRCFSYVVAIRVCELVCSLRSCCRVGSNGVCGMWHASCVRIVTSRCLCCDIRFIGECWLCDCFLYLAGV